MDVSSPILKQYDYRPHKWQTAALFLLALGGELLLAYFALFLDGPINVRGFRLNQTQGRIFFGVFAVFSSIGLFSLGAMVYVAFAYDRRVALTRTHVILPKPTRMGLSRDEIHIPFDTIGFVSVDEFIGATRLLRLDYSNGTVSIASNLFRNREEFEDLCRSVQEAVASAAQRHPT